MTKQERNFKGVWIPKEIWEDKNIGWSEKLLLVEIESLDNEEGCFASNEHFADFFGLSKSRISKMFSSLKNKGYITIEFTYKEGKKEIDRRIAKVIRGYGNKVTYGISQIDNTPIAEKCEDNNTSINNTINNTINNNNVQSQIESMFENWYSCYPKKQSKGEARKSFAKRIKEGITIDELNKGLENYLRYIAIKKIDKSYIKMPATWLNQECYNDEYDFTPKQGGNYGRNQTSSQQTPDEDYDNFSL